MSRIYKPDPLQYCNLLSDTDLYLLSSDVISVICYWTGEITQELQSISNYIYSIDRTSNFIVNYPLLRKWPAVDSNHLSWILQLSSIFQESQCEMSQSQNIWTLLPHCSNLTLTCLIGETWLFLHRLPQNNSMKTDTPEISSRRV